MSSIIRKFEHYLNFLENFYAIPSSYKTAEEIKSSSIYQEGDKIMNEIKPIFYGNYIK